MKKIYRLLFALVLLTAVTGCDQVTKVIARDQLASSPPVSLLNGVIRLVYSQNSGAFLSLGAQLPASLRFLFFVVFAGGVLAALVAFILREEKVSLLLLTGLSLLACGGIGNLIDRILHHGDVVDFMILQVGSLHTGIFNVADLAIVAGVCVVLLASLRPHREPIG